MSEHDPVPIGDPAPAPDSAPVEPGVSPTNEIEGGKNDVVSPDPTATSVESPSEPPVLEPTAEVPAAPVEGQVKVANEAVLEESRKHTRRAFVAAAARRGCGLHFLSLD